MPSNSCTTAQLCELGEWLMALDRSSAFLFALPFIVAFAGLAAEFVRHRRIRSANRKIGEAR
jgi:hypothetical protein